MSGRMSCSHDMGKYMTKNQIYTCLKYFVYESFGKEQHCKNKDTIRSRR